MLVNDYLMFLEYKFIAWQKEKNNRKVRKFYKGEKFGMEIVVRESKFLKSIKFCMITINNKVIILSIKNNKNIRSKYDRNIGG